MVGGSDKMKSNSRNPARMKATLPFQSSSDMHDRGFADFNNDIQYASTIGAGGGDDLFQLHLEPTRF